MTIPDRPRRGEAEVAAATPTSRPLGTGIAELWTESMYETLMEAVVEGTNAANARDAVIRNRGAAGIDRMTTDAIRSCGYHVECRCVQPPDARSARPVVWEGAGAQSPAPDPIVPPLPPVET